MRVVLDAFGTDRAPEPEVEGALMALEDDPDLEVVLVGPVDILKGRLGAGHPRLKLVDAEQVVHHDEKPSEVLRTKKRSSIAVGLDLLRNREADAFVSAGNTGVIMGFSLVKLKRIKGIKRPAICALFPNTAGGRNVILDVGANIYVKSDILVQFALMGSAYYRAMFSKKPKVALLSIGEEDTKGGEILRKARDVLESLKGDFDFVGYVEGHEILSEKADVIVMDGFVGNALLKFGESILDTLVNFIKQEVSGNPRAMIGAYLLKPVFKNIKKKADFEEYGGAPLLGIDGVVVVSHGRSTSKAIRNAIGVAKRMVTRGMVSLVEQNLSHAKTQPPIS